MDMRDSRGAGHGQREVLGQHKSDFLIFLLFCFFSTGCAEIAVYAPFRAPGRDKAHACRFRSNGANHHVKHGNLTWTIDRTTYVYGTWM